MSASWLYDGKLGEAIVEQAQHPTTTPDRPVMGGKLGQADLAASEALTPPPITSSYYGYDVYGMPVPTSGGIAVAEILNLVEAYEAKTGRASRALTRPASAAERACLLDAEQAQTRPIPFGPPDGSYLVHGEHRVPSRLGRLTRAGGPPYPER